MSKQCYVIIYETRDDFCRCILEKAAVEFHKWAFDRLVCKIHFSLSLSVSSYRISFDVGILSRHIHLIMSRYLLGNRQLCVCAHNLSFFIFGLLLQMLMVFLSSLMWGAPYSLSGKRFMFVNKLEWISIFKTNK